MVQRPVTSRGRVLLTLLGGRGERRGLGFCHLVNVGREGATAVENVQQRSAKTRRVKRKERHHRLGGRPPQQQRSRQTTTDGLATCKKAIAPFGPCSLSPQGNANNTHSTITLGQLHDILRPRRTRRENMPSTGDLTSPPQAQEHAANVLFRRPGQRVHDINPRGEEEAHRGALGNGLGHKEQRGTVVHGRRRPREGEASDPSGHLQNAFAEQRQQGGVGPVPSRYPHEKQEESATMQGVLARPPHVTRNGAPAPQHVRTTTPKNGHCPCRHPVRRPPPPPSPKNVPGCQSSRPGRCP